MPVVRYGRKGPRHTYHELKPGDVAGEHRPVCGAPRLYEDTAEITGLLPPLALLCTRCVRYWQRLQRAYRRENRKGV